ncbi:hypothetical protein [Pleomorphovibrio marinus]|uniref:hypothetical protein n=1 Tax=Pleomorphovibrio marinus TaxID=2164132 RepID=UPI001300914A|nr:hypothetical protein [Pleomorphovibrio marinus]
METIGIPFYRIGAFILLASFFGCLEEKDPFLPSVDGPLLQRVEMEGKPSELLDYDNQGRIRTFSSSMFYRGYHYDAQGQLAREEVTVSPDSFRSYMPIDGERDWADPEKHGISGHSTYVYDEAGKIERIAYFFSPQDELRSTRAFVYGTDGFVERMNLYDGEEVLRQYWTYGYDGKGNLTEENYYVLQEGETIHMTRTQYAFDSNPNPYRVLAATGNPGIFSNPNNIVRISVTAISPDAADHPERSFDYDYDSESGYPVGSSSGEVFVYR